MKKIIYFLFFIYLYISCQSDTKNNDLLKVKIVGLKKGTVYLNTIENGKMIPADSIRTKGRNELVFDLRAYEPRLMALTLKEQPENYLLFFADDTINTIQTSLRKFGLDTIVHSGINYRQWMAYRHMLSQYNDRKLDLIKEEMEAVKNNDTSRLNDIRKKLFSLERKRIKYALHFSFTHKNLPIGAYVAATELQGNKKLLDTLYSSLPDKIKSSLYGKQIKSMLDTMK